MDCTGEAVCVLCEIVLENEQERAQHDMTLKARKPYQEEWDAQP